MTIGYIVQSCGVAPRAVSVVPKLVGTGIAFIEGTTIPTTEQAEAAIALRAAKQAKIAALSAGKFAPVTVGGITLATDSASQLACNHAVTAIQLAQSQQSDLTALNGQNVSALFGMVTDATGAEHDMTVAQFITLMAGYAQAIGAARAAYQAKVAAVNAAATMEAVNAIN
jgi:hypothetical protein